jgi:uncharacterized protein DUF4242
MPVFLAETYAADPDLAAAESARALAAATALASEGIQVSILRSIYVPEDEMSFWLIDAPSPQAVREAGRRAQVGFDRVTRTLTKAELP